MSGKKSIIETESNYLTDVEGIFKRELGDLLQSADLPYNPYPHLAHKITSENERFHFQQISEDDISPDIERPVINSDTQFLAHTEFAPHVWGTRRILQGVHNDVIASFQWLVDDIFPRKYTHLDGYKTNIVSVLRGPAIFTSTFFPHTKNIDIHFDVFIRGPDIRSAIGLFIAIILDDVENFEEKTSHIFIGAEFMSTESDDITTWEVDRIRHDHEAFAEALKHAVIDNRTISMQFVFKVKENPKTLVKGQKTYCLNYIETPPGGGRHRVWSFTNLPYSSLHTGVFIEESHAQWYFSTIEGPYDTRTAEYVAPDDITRELKLKPKLLCLSERDQGDEEDSYLWQFSTSLRTSHQSILGRCSSHLDVLTNLYSVIVLILVDCPTFIGKLGSEIYRLLNTSVGRLERLRERVNTLNLILTHNQQVNNQQMLGEMLVQHACDLKAILNNVLQDIPIADLALYKCALRKVDNILVLLDNGRMDHATHHLFVNEVRGLLHYYDGMILAKMAACLQICPELKGLLEVLQMKYSPCYKTVDETLLKRSLKVKVADNISESDTGNVSYDSTDFKVAELSKKNDLSSKQAILLKYLVNSHMDEVWTDYLTDILTFLPPNPFPKLITCLHNAAFRMDQDSMEDEILGEELAQTDTKPSPLGDGYVHMYQIKYTEVYGCRSILSFADLTKVLPILTDAKKLLESSYVKDNHKVMICTCFAGTTMLLGRILPSIPEILIHSHIYVESATPLDDVMSLCAQIVQQEVKDLSLLPSVIISGIFVGQRKFSFDEVREQRSAFITAFASACVCRDSIYLKILLHNQKTATYTPAKKCYILHHHPPQSRSSIYGPPIHGNFYLSVFLDQHQAIFHERMTYMNGTDPMSAANVGRVSRGLTAMIDEAVTSDNIHDYYWFQLQMAVILKDSKLLALSKKFYNSVAMRLHHVIGLVNDAEDFLQYVLEKGVTTPVQRSVVADDKVDDLPINVKPSSGWLQKKRVLTKRVTLMDKQADVPTAAKNTTEADLLRHDSIAIIADLRQKVLDVTKHSCVQMGADLTQYIDSYFGTMFITHQNSQLLVLKLEKQTIQTLSSIRYILSAVCDTLLVQTDYVLGQGMDNST